MNPGLYEDAFFQQDEHGEDPDVALSSELRARKAQYLASRTQAETNLFRHGVRDTWDLFFAHKGVTVYFCPPVTRTGDLEGATSLCAGWSRFERCAATEIKRACLPRKVNQTSWMLALDLADEAGQDHNGRAVDDPWLATRQWPTAPDEFDEGLAQGDQGHMLGIEDDGPLIGTLFREMRVRQLGGVRALKFESLPIPSAADCRRLGRCLNLCGILEKLGLAGVGLSDEACCALFSVLGEGSLGECKKITLFNNSIGDDGACAIAVATVDGALRKLRWLSLANNLIGDRGIEAITDAMAKGAMPELEELCLGHNPFNDAVRARLKAQCASRDIILKKDRYDAAML